ncbi:MAG: glutamate synthase subunit alpha, partial [Myxococcales bacterium]
MSLFTSRGLPLSDYERERDACGVGFVANIKGERSHELVEKGLLALEHLEHRGACGCDPESGDGAGAILHIPHDLFAEVCGEAGIKLPGPGVYGVGMVFLPPSADALKRAKALLEESVARGGLEVLGWRDVPVDLRHCGKVSQSNKPHIAQIFIGRGKENLDEDALERRLYVVRRIAEHASQATHGELAEHFYLSSLSCRTVCYKG